jgi:rhodanese-related sulfurtransferase
MQNNVIDSDQSQNQNFADQGLISLEELRARLDRGAPIQLLEALSEQHYLRGHLPGAIQFPHDQVRRLAPLVLPDAGQSIVVYCASKTCRNSQIAAGVLRQLGYQDVRVYAGGKQDWEAAGLTLER